MITKQSIKRYLKEPRSSDCEAVFEMSSWNMWAVEEAFRFIDDHPEYSVVDALDLFIRKMDDYACKARTERSSRMFSTAKDIAEDILDSFLFEFH